MIIHENSEACASNIAGNCTTQDFCSGVGNRMIVVNTSTHHASVKGHLDGLDEVSQKWVCSLGLGVHESMRAVTGYKAEFGDLLRTVAP
jgi:hypothetical protein